MSLSGSLTYLIQQAVDRHEVPCATVLVLKDGEEIAYAEAGSDILTGKPVCRDTIFRLYNLKQ